MDEVKLNFNVQDGNNPVFYLGKSFGWSQPKKGDCSYHTLPGPKCDYCSAWTLKGALKKNDGP